MWRRIGRTAGVARIILRLIFGLIGLAVLLFVVLGFVAQAQGSTREPTVTEAPWLVKTSSRIYYAREYKFEAGLSSIRGYWEVSPNGKHFIYHKDGKDFPSRSYGKITVVRRSPNVRG